jgi:ankyrin repeat/IBR domain-containing protein 1
LALCWEQDAVAPVNKFFDADVVPQNLTCAAGHGMCLQCDGEAHAPCSCVDWKIWLARVEKELRVLDPSVTKNTTDNKAAVECDERKQGGGDDVANALWVRANTKPCPRCKTPIEKDEGCNHMA